jgi:hypothetical protein
MNWRGGSKIMLALALVFICLFEFTLNRQSETFREYAVAFLSLQSLVLLACLAVWCGTFLFLTFSLNDVLLIGLFFIAIASYFIGTTARPAMDALTLLFGVTLGKGAQFLFKGGTRKAESGIFLVGLVALLAFSSWWHLDMSANFYHGPRWMGLWNNPNIYGMLMSAGLVLAVGLLAARGKRMENGGWKMAGLLFIAAGVMAVGLLFSYSRGSWLGAAIGLLYLAWSYHKLRWRYVLSGVAVVAAVVFFFWSATPDDAPWYVKRLDLGRPSAQHRVSAWHGALQMMWDHPFGVGWNNAITVYEKNYSPPENGAAAITTNDYLMLGTQLGWPGLICFVTYVGLALKTQSRKQKAETLEKIENRKSEIGNQMACRAGALTLLVAFWFDGGLFTLATAAVFWVLLELGVERQKLKTEMLKAENTKPETRNLKAETIRQSAIGNRQRLRVLR